jgi:2-polyprenyl-3-methyl-5-hydroxy-6-metoxy-1,4-benzoquinol methylase
MVTDFILADGEKPPVRRVRYDIITSFTSIHHFESPEKFIEDIHKMPSKFIVISMMKKDEGSENIISAVKRLKVDKVISEEEKDYIILIKNIDEPGEGKG